MQPDLYTKSVLSVIAASLLWFCVQNANQPQVVSAQAAKQEKKKASAPASVEPTPPPQRVIIVGFGQNVGALSVTTTSRFGQDTPLTAAYGPGNL